MSVRKVEHLLIGGGLASANCARWLREAGGEGEIMLVGREPDPPYNRPPCSKGYLQGKESREETWFRPQEWWGEQRIDLRMRTSVTKLDVGAKEVTLSNKETVAYENALIATGANVRRLNVEGCELEGIHYLRTLGNSDAIRADAAGKRVVLIGGSYIGCEVAASLTLLGSSCTIVMQEGVALERGFGAQAGRFFEERLREHGVQIHGHDELERFEGTDGRVGEVLTKAGLRLQADAVVIGAGVLPDTTLARAAGLDLDEQRGGVLCDSRLRSSAPGVWAAGDIASYESVVHGGSRLRVEHWDVAFNHGRTVALNMLGQDTPHDVVPYFFSDLADWASLEYVGPAQGWDEEIVRGALDGDGFSVWYLKDGRVLAALSVGRSEDLDHARRLIADGARLGEERAALGDLSSELDAVGRAGL